MLSEHLSPGGASPTLTNPDMILPYFDTERDSYSPTPSYEPHELPSPSQMSPRNVHPSELMNGNTSTANRSRKKISPPRNLLSYDGYEHGAPLSDIGEEETTPRSRRTRSRSQSPVESSAIASHFAAAQRLFNEARLTTENGAGEWEGFDSGSGANSGLQGDDDDEDDDEEGSLDGTEKGEASRKDSLGSLGEEEMSSNALSKRAEIILANAKKRLTNMEGNLSRARTSLLTSPTNKSSFSVGEQMPAGGLYRSISQGGDRKLSGQSPLARFRQSQSSHSTSPLSHNRVSSETVAPSRPLFSPTYQGARGGEFRSASAMETSRGSATDSFLPENKPTTSDRTIRRSSSTVSRGLYQPPLKPLREDDNRPHTAQETPLQVRTQGLGITHANSYEDFQARHPPSGITRSTSQMQMRDISTKMNDLKSKISNLKVRAQQDHMRRRSLNNLRTPSPFTAAEQWYAGAAEYKEGVGGLNTNAGYGWSPKHEQGDAFPNTADSADVFDGPEHILPPRSVGQGTVIEHEDDDVKVDPSPEAAFEASPESAAAYQRSFVPESQYEDAFEEPSDEREESTATSEEDQIYLNEVLEESLHDEEQDVPEIPDVHSPEPERHEDRADAFDYEHFILHSALGSYSRAGLNRDSMMSDESVETARAATPPVSNEEVTAQTPSNLLAPPRRPHARNDSLDSVSTMATFATATEGRGSESGEESDSIPDEILAWGGHAPMPGAINMKVWPSTDSNNLSPSTVHVNGYPTPISEHHQIRPGTADSCSTSESASTTREFPLTNNNWGKLPTPPTLSPTMGRSSQRLSQGSDALLSSLVAASRSPSIGGPRSPVFAAENEAGVVLDDDDRDLLERLFASLGNVCVHLSDDSAESKYDRRVWRRRLDAARRILDGEIELE